MKQLLLASFVFFCSGAKGQPYKIDIPINLSVDSSIKPLFGFHYQSRPGYLYNVGYCRDKHNPNIGFNPLSGRMKFKGTDTFYCENLIDSSGEYWACIEAINTNGLRDTHCVKIYNDLKKDTNFLIYDNFYRENDSFDLYSSNCFHIKIDEASEIRMEIFDPWGKKVFDTNESNNCWMGWYRNRILDFCPEGTYYYKLAYRYKNKTANEPILNGMVHLWRY